jgi:hypothetical protein
MIYKDILTKRTYTKDGVEKAIWLNVGTLRTTDDGKSFIELNMYPNTPFYVFEKKAKEEPKNIDSDTGEAIPPFKKETVGLAEQAGHKLEDIPF